MRPLFECIKEEKKISKADEMLKKYGYYKKYEDEYEVKYEYKETELGDTFDFILLFAKKGKMFFHKDRDCKVIGINIELLQAINEKVKELRMDLENFMKLLSKAKKDRYGNLYVEEKDVNKDRIFKDLDKQRWYFSLSTTVCDDLIKEHSSKTDEGFEVYNRHFWNDDTLEIKIVRDKNKNYC